jgi:chaperonin GroES
MNLFPVFERIIIEIKKPDEKTAGGLIVPAVAQEKINEGVIVAIADDINESSSIGEEKKPSKFNIGDRVIFDKFIGTPYISDGKNLLIIKAEDIMAIVR